MCLCVGLEHVAVPKDKRGGCEEGHRRPGPQTKVHELQRKEEEPVQDAEEGPHTPTV